MLERDKSQTAAVFAVFVINRTVRECSWISRFNKKVAGPQQEPTTGTVRTSEYLEYNEPTDPQFGHWVKVNVATHLPFFLLRAMK